MAGIGVTLNRIFEKNTIITNILGFAYSTMSTITPMLVVIINLYITAEVMDVSAVSYANRQLFSCTVLYVFIFSMLSAAPFNAVISRYLSDIIYEERFEDILPCFYMGLLLNTIFACLLGIPFCVHEYLVGQVDIIYVFTGFLTYIALVFVYYTMLFLSICKDYIRISFYFFTGMIWAFGLSLVFFYFFHMEKMYSMLLALFCGFLWIACCEFALIHSYFRKNSRRYKAFLFYFRKYWKLVAANSLYAVGMYVHNFVFWTSDLHTTTARSFICTQPYDMATCVALFTNISASVIFISRVEMHFHEAYKEYSESVIGREWEEIVLAKKRMFAQLSNELVSLVRIQFIISIVIYILVMIFLPGYGFSGLALDMYPCLAAGYFILFIMYAELLFLYYFNDLNGAVFTGIGFFVVTLVGSRMAMRLPYMWYGIGFLAGTFTGWTIAYVRLRWVEHNLDEHIFCQETLIKSKKEKIPTSLVYKK